MRITEVLGYYRDKKKIKNSNLEKLLTPYIDDVSRLHNYCYQAGMNYFSKITVIDTKYQSTAEFYCCDRVHDINYVMRISVINYNKVFSKDKEGRLYCLNAFGNIIYKDSPLFQKTIGSIPVVCSIVYRYKDEY